MPLSKWDKLLVGGYIILKDFSDGQFPLKFDDRARAHQAEIDYYRAIPGVSVEDNIESHGRKPFWGADGFSKYSAHFVRLLRTLERVGLRPGCNLLEMGCGPGWMAEFLALSGYSVCGTTIMPLDVAIAEKRVAALRARGLTTQLSFKVSPMESVHEAVPQPESFDGVFVFEALHHSFDWREAIGSSHRCLREGGWLVLANEPNLLHTFISYRVARLSNTHEIGMSRKEIARQLIRSGFREIRVISPKPNNFITPHWIAAKK